MTCGAGCSDNSELLSTIVGRSRGGNFDEVGTGAGKSMTDFVCAFIFFYFLLYPSIMLLFYFMYQVV